MKQKGFLALMAGMLVIALYLPVYAVSYDNIVIFGDSLSDTGNIQALSPDSYNTDKFADGAFSNGMTWGSYLEGLLNYDGAYLIANALAGQWSPPEGNLIYNTAFGGAETGVLQAPPGFVTQVGIWAIYSIPLPQNSLCIVWIGGNDFLNWISDHTIDVDDPTTAINTAVTNIITGLTLLTNPDGLAATDIVVITLPDLGVTPANNGAYGVDNSASASELTHNFNAALKAALDGFDTANPGLNLSTYDINEILVKIVANPEHFGFNKDNITRAAYYETYATSGFNNVGRYVFWDEIHPTTEMHKIIANQVYGHVCINSEVSGIIFINPGDDEKSVIGVKGSQPDLEVKTIAAGSEPDTTSNINRPDTFYYGIFDFSMSAAPGAQATVNVYLPEAAPANARWYFSTPAGWIDFTRSTLNDSFGDGAVFSADRKSVTIYLTDNGNYDNDNTLGFIEDTSALATMPAGDSSSGCFIDSILSDPIPGKPTAALLLLVIAGFGLWTAGRKNR